MRTVKKQYRKCASVLLALIMLTACGGKEPETAADAPGSITAVPDGGNEEVSDNSQAESGDAQSAASTEGAEVTQSAEPTEEAEVTQPAGPTEEAEVTQPAGPTEGAEAAHSVEPAEGTEEECGLVIRELPAEEWERLAQDETFLEFHSEDGGAYYIDPVAKTVYHRGIYAHERAEGSSEYPYFHPRYSSKSDETMLAPGGTDENGDPLYDVYYGKELLIGGLTGLKEKAGGEYPLDVCYDAEAGEILFLMYHGDPDKKEEGFMIYHTSEADPSVQPLRFYPILTGDNYRGDVNYDWIWTPMLTPEAIYYDILPVQRIDLETGEVTEWGLTEEAYTEVTGIDNPIRHNDTKAAGDGYILTVVKNGDTIEITLDTYLIYTETGELVYSIPNMR